jgi:hypothetical protein
MTTEEFVKSVLGTTASKLEGESPSPASVMAVVDEGTAG